MHSMTVTQRKFFEQLRMQESVADAAGAEAGLRGLDEEAFKEMIRAEIERMIEESIMLPPTGVLKQHIQSLQERREALQARADEIGTKWRPAAVAISEASSPFRWRRILLCFLLAMLTGLFVHMFGHEQHWETFALLSVAAALVGLGPWHFLPHAKSAYMEVT